MDNNIRGPLIGGIIILLGLLSMASNFKIGYHLSTFTVAGLFFLFSYLFFNIFMQNNKKKWALVLGIILSFAGSVYLLNLLMAIINSFIGAILLWLGTFICAYIYSKHPNRWWLIIPTGILFTLGTISIVTLLGLLRTDQVGIVFFLGSGLTFIYLWIQRSESLKLAWAKNTGIILLIIAIIIYFETEPWLNTDVLFPMILIAAGSYLLIKTATRK